MPYLYLCHGALRVATGTRTGCRTVTTHFFKSLRVERRTLDDVCDPLRNGVQCGGGVPAEVERDDRHVEDAHVGGPVDPQLRVYHAA